MTKIFRSISFAPLLFCPSCQCQSSAEATVFRSGSSWLQLSPRVCRWLNLGSLGSPSESLWYSVVPVLEGGTRRDGRRRFTCNPDQVRLDITEVVPGTIESVALVVDPGNPLGCHGRIEVPVATLPGKVRSSLPWLLQSDAPFRLTDIRCAQMTVLTPGAAALIERQALAQV